MISRALGVVRSSFLPLSVATIATLFIVRVSQGAPLAPPAVRASAPPFSLTDLQGHHVSLESYRGRTLLLNFWASWCGACRAELPALEELSRSQPGCLAVLGVALESGDADAVAAFARERGLHYPVALDDGQTARDYNVVTIPHTALIGPDGKLLGVFRGSVTVKGVESALRDLRVPAVC